jgi:hypothetical protein
MPLSTPIEVMPICTGGQELGRVVVQVHGRRAPASPASTITCRRALRLAVSAISDMANNPFSRIRKKRAGQRPCGAGAELKGPGALPGKGVERG